MKKIIACVLTVFTLIVCGKADNKLMFSGKEGTYSFYCRTQSSNADVTEVSSAFALKTKRNLQNVEGESLCFANDGEYVDKVVAFYEAKEVKRESVDGVECVYLYSDKIKDFVVVDGVKINLHIAYAEHYTTIGTPFIFGGY